MLAITRDGLACTLVFGAYGEHESALLCEAWRKTLDGPMRDSLLDTSALRDVDAAAFPKVRDALETRRAERARVVRRQAIVSGLDFCGAIVRGYLSMFPPPYPVQVFERRGDALAWLGHAMSAGELDELDVSCAELLVRLRAWLDAEMSGACPIGRAARALGVTTRTLQRRLAEADTLYSMELAHARVARAQRLMGEPSRKLSDIALDVGCATPAAFADLFRKTTGSSPSAWRARVYGAPSCKPRRAAC